MLRTLALGHWAKGIFFGWWILGGAIGIQILTAGLLFQAYGLYIVSMQAEFGWSKTAFAVAYSLQQLGGGLLGPYQGRLLERFGPRLIIRIGLIAFATGLMLFSQVQSLTTFYLVFILMALGASLGGFMSLTTTIVNWFERRRSMALAFLQVGLSIGGLMAPLVAWALTSYGWRPTAFASGLIVLVVGLPLTNLMRTRPEDYGLLPDGAKVPDEDNYSRGLALRDFTPRQALRTRSFWFISVGHALAMVVVSAVLVHLVIHLNEDLGYSLQTAANVLALLTGMTMIGHITGGFLGDRFNKRLLATCAMFGHAAGLLILALAHSLAPILLFAVVHGLSWGLRGPVMQAIRADYFGRTYFASILGFSFMVVMVGMMSGPVIAGLMVDLFGSYRSGFFLLAGMALIGSVFFMFASKPTPPTAQPPMS